MTYEEAIAEFGTQTKLAEALGIKQSTVSAWGEGTRGNRVMVVPKLYQFQIEVITNGRLKADPELRFPAARATQQPQAWDGKTDRRRRAGQMR